jgi:hypothetical protein
MLAISPPAMIDPMPGRRSVPLHPNYEFRPRASTRARRISTITVVA